VAVTVAGRRLTESHRLEQVALQAFMSAVMIRLAPMMSSTPEAWAVSALVILSELRRRSADAAARYASEFRVAEVGSPRLVKPVSEVTAAVATSLRVTGPVTLRRALARGATVQEAIRAAAASSAGAAARHVANGGRDTLLAAVANDPQATGYARVTDGNPCAFCAALASRGTVYRSEMRADFPAHDRCGCVVEPSYRGSKPPGRSDEFRDLWREATQGQSGADALRAFRRAYETSRP
jgi:hypothetical protein